MLIEFDLLFNLQKKSAYKHYIFFPELFKRNYSNFKIPKKKDKNHKLFIKSLKQINSFNSLERYISTGQILNLFSKNH